MTLTIIDAGLLLLAASFGMAFGFLTFYSGRMKDLSQENTQLKLFTDFLLKERQRAGVTERPAYVPPFMNFDIDGDMTVGGDVAGRDKTSRAGG